MNELMKCATNVKHLISPMFRCLAEHVSDGCKERFVQLYIDT